MQSATLSPKLPPAALTPTPSPKRKRDPDHSDETSNRPIRLRTNLPSRSFNPFSSGQMSPRTAVSTQLESLNLHSAIPVLDFGRKPDGPPIFLGSGPGANHGLSSANTKPTRPRPSPSRAGLPSSGSFNSIDALVQGQSTPTRTSPLHGAAPASTSMMRTQSDTPVRSSPHPPATPRLQPTEPAAPSAISPLATTSTPPFPTAPSLPTTTSSFSSPSATTTHPSTRPKSPPPATGGPHSDLVWAADEITGHDPTDPADDGRGINGIGFRPTKAMEAKRALARRRSVMAWKAREAREARQRRAERRGAWGAGAAMGGEGSAVGAGRRVRFAEG